MSMYQDLLEGEEEYLWHLRDMRDKALSEFVEYTLKSLKQGKLVEEIKREAANLPTSNEAIMKENI